jgi:hypothetical protein
VDVELFETAIEVVASVVPRICGPVFVDIGPAVGQVDFAAFRTHVGECVEYVGELVGWDLLRLVVAAIDSPVLLKCQRPVQSSMAQRSEVPIRTSVVMVISRKRWHVTIDCSLLLETDI